ncbi:MAG: glutamate--cysteine ligase [Commensalibacter sp.]|nr:glutamate--cysteine ligase [Commensalibacter sp.]
MSNVSNHDDTPLVSISQMVSYLEAGCKPSPSWRIGTEHEKFGFIRSQNDAQSYLPPPYSPNGIGAILSNLQKAHPDWKSVSDRDCLIGLTTDTGAGISLEPAGQFELSGTLLANLHETAQELKTHIQSVHQAADPMGIGFAPLGFHPFATRQQMPWMPKRRYEIMRAYMPKVGTMGLDMMQRTCTVQVNLDFSSEIDMARKMRVSMALQPLATALFANSPFYEGKPSGYLSTRAYVWTDTDNNRAGLPASFFEDSFGFERYIEWLLDVPMYFVLRNGEMIDVAGASLREWMSGKAPKGLEGQRPTMEDFENHVTVAFPDVRLKRYLEMRGADAGSPDMMLAMSALWVGLLYDEPTLLAAEKFLKEMPWQAYEALRPEVPKYGLSTSWRKGNLRNLLKPVVELAIGGLKNRKVKNADLEDEAFYLNPLMEIAEGKPTQAEHWLNRYETVWKGDVKQIFEEARI